MCIRDRGKYDLTVTRTENEIIATINALMDWLVFIEKSMTSS